MLNHANKIYPKDTIQDPEQVACPRDVYTEVNTAQKEGTTGHPSSAGYLNYDEFS